MTFGYRIILGQDQHFRGKGREQIGLQSGWGMAPARSRVYAMLYNC